MNYTHKNNCPQCNSGIYTYVANVKNAGCPHCGCVATMGNGQVLQKYKIFTPLHELREHKGYSMFSNSKTKPFYLGKDIRYEGKLYRVYAIYVYYVVYEEFDKQDNHWQNVNGYITEWYAESVDELPVILMQDTDKKFYFIRKIDNNRLTIDTIQNKSDEFGTFQLVSFAGTDNDVLDEKGHYRIVANNYLVESETIAFNNNTHKTFERKALSASQIKRMQIIENTKKMQAEEDFTSISFYRNLCAAALLAILGLMVLESRVNTEGVGKGNSVGFSYKMLEGGQLDTAEISPKSAGIFNLEAGRNYLFSARANIVGQNKDADFSVSIVNVEDAKEVSEIDIGFFTESGRDDEGDWTETFLADEFKFQVEKSGKYDVLVSPDYEAISAIPSSNLTIDITETPHYYFYWVTFGAFLLGLIIFQWQRETLAATANLPHGTYLHDLTNP